MLCSFLNYLIFISLMVQDKFRRLKCVLYLLYQECVMQAQRRYFNVQYKFKQLFFTVQYIL